MAIPWSGSFAVEIVLSWPGLGQLMYDALVSRDIYLVAGCAAAGSLFLAAGTLLSDVVWRWPTFAHPGNGITLRTEHTRTEGLKG